MASIMPSAMEAKVSRSTSVRGFPAEKVFTLSSIWAMSGMPLRTIFTLGRP